jgi:predicted transcriptional regulator
LSKGAYDSLLKQQTKPSETPEGRRSLLQIRIDILRVVMEGYGKPTQIMYKANLSWNVLQAQLKSFVEAEMLSVEKYGTRRKYIITPRGEDMVRSYQKVVSEMLG